MILFYSVKGGCFIVKIMINLSGDEIMKLQISSDRIIEDKHDAVFAIHDMISKVPERKECKY